MIEYALHDIDENEYELTGSGIALPARKSVTFLNDNFKFENRIIESSALPGGVKLGKTRLTTNNLKLEVTRAHTDSDDFRNAENEFIMWCEKALYLVDNTNGRRLKLAIEDVEVSYDSGGHKLSSETKATFRLIDPFWEASSEIEEDESLIVDINSIPISNEGFLKTYPVITIVTAAALDSIEMYIDETKEGIVIEDAIFGTSTYLTMICDCLAGTLMIGDLDRSASIVGGTGYFSFPVGESTLIVIPSEVCDINVAWRIREYV